MPLREAAPFRPATPYAASKAAAEIAGVQAHLGWGLDVVRVRPFTHTGPGQTSRFFVPNMACQIVEAHRTGATELRTGNLTVRRDILDVRDIVRAYRMLAVSGQAGEAYNVCSGSSVPLASVVQRLLELDGSSLVVATDEARMRPVDLPDLRGDPSHLFHDTGWQPEYSLDQTLADVLAFWRAHAVEAPDEAAVEAADGAAGGDRAAAVEAAGAAAVEAADGAAARSPG